MSLGAVLFDLDGTVVDSAPIVTSLFALTAKEISGKDYEPEELLKYVGPPLPWTMMDLGADEKDVPYYIDYYRSHYNALMLDSPLFDGIDTVIRNLAARVPVAVATSKKESGARLILDRYGLLDTFTAVCGGSEDGLRSDKEQIVGEAIRRIGPVDGEIIMVGDRVYDIEGAAAHGLRAVLVGWGAGTPDEHDMAWRSAATPAELEDILLGV
ncbi:HAD family hydrolase [Flaviflexus salsibiostraticola]|uniref:HAD family hydrolase n=1 Tax=Flaviflexus salsibiostraticola TaxID=1282737 RepID=A0A3Q8WS47_9ACTO|nr:HAD hydrolase-like protein [Flaviflexus salsibiostraticola]AZN28993.1 HAD family hydrolase [Flaviflexus salsibiostraticola]